jgi:hypothetical protein
LTSASPEAQPGQQVTKSMIFVMEFGSLGVWEFGSFEEFRSLRLSLSIHPELNHEVDSLEIFKARAE